MTASSNGGGVFNGHSDEQIASRLTQEQFIGPHSESIVSSLWVYGHRILLSWIRSDEIFSRCAAVHRPVKPSTHWSFTSEETRLELTDETVMSGLILFKESLTAGKWDPTRGASLRTYFLKSCILSFPNTYRWMRTREEKVPEPLDFDQMHGIVEKVLRRGASRESIFCEIELLGAELSTRSPTIRSILSYTAEGYSAAETAYMLQCNQKAVENTLNRVRKYLDSARSEENQAKHVLKRHSTVDLKRSSEVWVKKYGSSSIPWPGESNMERTPTTTVRWVGKT